jgi:predicted nucleic acid-binding protein
MWSSFEGRAFYLDTNIIIYAIEGKNSWSDVLRELFRAVDERAIHTFTSELTVAEVLVKPFELGAIDLVATYEELLAPDSLIRVIPIDRPILRSAAELCGRMRLKLADAIHVATALQCACEFMLSNDEQFGQRMQAPIQWLSLSHVMDLAKAEPK